MLLGRGAAVRALLATCAPSPCASKVRRKPEAFPLRGLSLSRTERVRGVESVGRPVREKYCKLFSVREDQSLYTRVSLHRVKEWVLSGQNRSKQSYYGSLYYQLRDHACMSYMCVVAMVEDLEARALKSSAQTKAPGNTPRANARPTQDGRRGLQRQRERDGGCLTNWFRRKTRGVFII